MRQLVMSPRRNELNGLDGSADYNGLDNMLVRNKGRCDQYTGTIRNRTGAG